MSSQALPPPPARSEGGLYGASSQRSSGRWLWFGGLSDNTAEGPDLHEWIEGQRGREGSGGASHGTFSVHRHAGGAWVLFTGPTFAQCCVHGLNGRELPGGGNLRVRYAGFYEDVSGPPGVQYAKRPLPAASARSQARPRVGGASEAAPAGASKQPRDEGAGDSRGGSAITEAAAGAGDAREGNGKRLKTEGSATSPSPRPSKLDDGKPPATTRDELSSVANDGHSDAGSSTGPSANASAARLASTPPSARAGVASGPKASQPASQPASARGPQWDGGTWTNADVLRVALRCAHPPGCCPPPRAAHPFPPMLRHRPSHAPAWWRGSPAYRRRWRAHGSG